MSYLPGSNSSRHFTIWVGAMNAMCVTPSRSTSREGGVRGEARRVRDRVVRAAGDGRQRHDAAAVRERRDVQHHVLVGDVVAVGQVVHDADADHAVGPGRALGLAGGARGVEQPAGVGLVDVDRPGQRILTGRQFVVARRSPPSSRRRSGARPSRTRPSARPAGPRTPRCGPAPSPRSSRPGRPSPAGAGARSSAPRPARRRSSRRSPRGSPAGCPSRTRPGRPSSARGRAAHHRGPARGPRTGGRW